MADGRKHGGGEAPCQGLRRERSQVRPRPASLRAADGKVLWDYQLMQDIN